MTSAVASAIDHIGLSPIARMFDIWPSAVQKWRDNQCLPESELSGRTRYAVGIEELSDGKYKAEDLLAETRAIWENRAPRGRKRKRIGRAA